MGTMCYLFELFAIDYNPVEAAVHLHCGPSFALITVLVSCGVMLPGRVPYGWCLRCMLGPQGEVSRRDPFILRYNRMHMFPQARLPASL